MKPYKTFAAAALAAAFPMLCSTAEATVINFDNLAEGTVLSNQYATLGVTFVANAFSGTGSSSSGEDWATNTDMTITSSTAGDVGGLGAPSLVSGNVLHAYGLVYDGWGSEDGDPSFFINFATPISAISMAFAGVAAPSDTRIFAYNGATLLGVVAGTVTTGQFTLSFNAPSITRVGVANGSYDDWVAVDNINFTSAVAAVPEPATWAMLISGFGMIGGAMRRRRTVRVSYAA